MTRTVNHDLTLETHNHYQHGKSQIVGMRLTSDHRHHNKAYEWPITVKVAFRPQTLKHDQRPKTKACNLSPDVGSEISEVGSTKSLRPQLSPGNINLDLMLEAHNHDQKLGTWA